MKRTNVRELRDGLTVADGPKVTVSVLVNDVLTSERAVVERSTVSLECSTTVANPPVIPGATWWLRNGVPIQDGRRALVMHRLDRTQAGRYTCSATNTLAPSGEPPRNVTGTATVQLQVMCKSLLCVSGVCINGMISETPYN